MWRVRWAGGYAVWAQDTDFEVIFGVKAALRINHHFSMGLHKITSTMLNNFLNLVISLSEKT